jgi:hypothetical protein
MSIAAIPDAIPNASNLITPSNAHSHVRNVACRHLSAVIIKDAGRLQSKRPIE